MGQNEVGNVREITERISGTGGEADCHLASSVGNNPNILWRVLKILLHYIYQRNQQFVPRLGLTRWCSLDHSNFRCDDLSWRERILCQLFWQRESRINPQLKGINQTVSKCDGTFVNSSQLQEILRTELSEDSLEISTGVSLGELSPMPSHQCFMNTWPLIWNWNIIVLFKFSSNPNKRTICSRLFVQYLIEGVTLQIWPLLMSATWGGTRRAWTTTTSSWPTATWWRTGRGPSSMSPLLIRWVRWGIRLKFDIHHDNDSLFFG